MYGNIWQQCVLVCCHRTAINLVFAVTYTDGTRALLGATVEAHSDASTPTHR